MNNIYTRENLYTLVGQSLEFCQTIEHDIKIIYALILPGDFNDNLTQIKTDTLGQTIIKLETEDLRLHKNLFLKEQYRFLKQLSKERNYLAHYCFNNFNYLSNQEYEVGFKHEFDHVKELNKKLCSIWQSIELIKNDLYQKED